MKLQQHVNSLFDSLSEPDDNTVISYAPRVNIVDSEDKYQVTAELPGLEREDVKVELNNNLLTISGEKKDVQEQQDRNIYLCERSYGTFRRTFQLPSQVDAGKISAGFQNGVLTVDLPKLEEAKPKQIEIKVN